MYRFSRSIYREIAPHILDDEQGLNGSSNDATVLDACEGAMRRLAFDRRYFARPARSLFGEVRCYFPIGVQRHLYQVIERNIDLAIEHLARLPEEGVGLGQPSECRAHTRKGTPCQRQPLPGRDYCPSHKHLEEPLDSLEVVEDAFGPFEEGSPQTLDAVGAAA